MAETESEVVSTSRFKVRPLSKVTKRDETTQKSEIEGQRFEDLSSKTNAGRKALRGPYTMNTIPSNNRLLAALPRDEYERLLPNLESVRLPKNRILHEAGDTIHHAYFLNSGMAAVLAITEEGRTIELGVVGNDGYVGVPLIHDVDSASYRVMVQTPATAMKIKAELLSVELDSGGAMRRLPSRYAHGHETQMVQGIATKNMARAATLLL